MNLSLLESETSGNNIYDYTIRSISWLDVPADTDIQNVSKLAEKHSDIKKTRCYPRINSSSQSESQPRILTTNDVAIMSRHDEQ